MRYLYIFFFISFNTFSQAPVSLELLDQLRVINDIQAEPRSSRADCFQSTQSDFNSNRFCGHSSLETGDGSDATNINNSSRRFGQLREICQSDAANQSNQRELERETIEDYNQAIDNTEAVNSYIDLGSDPLILYTFSKITGYSPRLLDFELPNNDLENAGGLFRALQYRRYRFKNSITPNDSDDWRRSIPHLPPSSLDESNCLSSNGPEQFAQRWAAEKAGIRYPEVERPSMQRSIEDACSINNYRQIRRCPRTMPLDEYESHCDTSRRAWSSERLSSYSICARPDCDERGETSQYCLHQVQHYSSCVRDVERYNTQIRAAEETEQQRILSEFRTQCLAEWRVRSFNECVTEREHEKREKAQGAIDCREEGLADYASEQSTLNERTEQQNTRRDSLQTELEESYLVSSIEVCYGDLSNKRRAAVCNARTSVPCGNIQDYTYRQDYQALSPEIKQQQLDLSKAIVRNVRQYYSTLLVEENEEGQSRLEQCVEQVGVREACEKLNTDFERTNNKKMKEVYTDQRMKKLEQLEKSAKSQFETLIDKFSRPPTSMNAAQIELLKERLNGIELVRPDSAITTPHGSWGVCYCHTHEGINPVSGRNECNGTSIVLDTSYMAMLDSDLGQKRVMSLLLHEMGHSITGQSGDPNDSILGNLSTCLRDKVNYPGFTGFNGSQPNTLETESIADWFSAQVLGQMMGEVGSQEERAELLAQSMGGTMCSSIDELERRGQIACLVDENNEVRYPASIGNVTINGNQVYGVQTPSGPVRCPFNITHPKYWDRYAMYLRSNTIRQSLGCIDDIESPNELPDGRVETCQP